MFTSTRSCFTSPSLTILSAHPSSSLPSSPANLSFRKPRLFQRARASVEEAAMALDGKTQERWVSFPFLSNAARTLMEDIAGIMDSELHSVLNPSRTPPDVRSFKNPQGNGEGSITIRSGKQGSKVDFVLGSWIHCNMPFGALNIATLIGMLNLETDAPHLLFEFIQTGPSSLVLVLDLLPRKDLVLDPDYLKRFYEDTGLENIRKELEKGTQAQLYVSSALYIRCLISPTAILFSINGQTPSGEPIEGGMEGIVSEAVHPAAKRVIKIWLEGISTTGRVLQVADREVLVKRDHMIKTKGVEVDLSSNMPRLFGQEIADRVVEAFRKGE